MGIQSFADKRTEEVYNGLASARTRSFPPDLLRAAVRKLDMLDAAHSLKDLAAARGNSLEALKGKWAGEHSIRINDQWRIVFRWTPAGPTNVKIIDYH